MKKENISKLVDSLSVEELSSREELVEMMTADKVDQDQEITILSWNISI